MSLYIWKVGEIALAKLSQTAYAKVQVVKNGDGFFHGKKVLGISPNSDGSLNVTYQLCYFIEICRTKETLWLPYTSLQLAERSRPFYGPSSKMQSSVLSPVNTPKKSSISSPEDSPPDSPDDKSSSSGERKRKMKEDKPLPTDTSKIAKLSEPEVIIYESRHVMKDVQFDNAFKEFMQREKDSIFDEMLLLATDNPVKREYYENLIYANTSSDEVLEAACEGLITEKDVEIYLQQCWRFMLALKDDDVDTETDNSSVSDLSSPEKVLPEVHSTWCLVCGKRGDLVECLQCPSSFHVSCRKLWLITIFHRKNLLQIDGPEVSTTISKIYSSTRAKSTTSIEIEDSGSCPSCMWGPNVGYGDIVWYKLAGVPWWPAKVLTPGEVPTCLLSRKHGCQNYAVQFYGDHQYTWCDLSRMCLFLPSHTAVLDENKSEELQGAVMDACDDYIRVYLT